MTPSGDTSKFKAFSREVKAQFPTCDVSLWAKRTGHAMMDVRIDGRLFVWIFDPHSGYGVDEVLDGEGFGSGYKYTFETFEESRDQLCKMIRAVQESK